MTATLIEEATKAGIELHLAGGQVTIKGAPETVAQWRDRLRENKAKIIDHLQAIDTVNRCAFVTHRPPGLSPTLLGASLALDARQATEKILRGLSLKPDVCPNLDTPPDRATERKAIFMRKGLTEQQAIETALRLEVRDVEADRRSLCLECVHLAGVTPASWRCSNWKVAGVAIQARDNALPVDLVHQLQHCDGFDPCFRSQNANSRLAKLGGL